MIFVGFNLTIIVLVLHVFQMMKSYIWLHTANGSIQQVEQEVAIFCPSICNELHTRMGSSKNYPVFLPARVNPAMLSLVLDYCRFHHVAGRSNKVVPGYSLQSPLYIALFLSLGTVVLLYLFIFEKGAFL